MMTGILILMLVVSAHPVKPVCTAEIKGAIWNGMNAQGRRIPTEMCVKKHRKYRWESLTVDISQLRAAKNRE